jgi:secreted PhoX family phosphatase
MNLHRRNLLTGSAAAAAFAGLARSTWAQSAPETYRNEVAGYGALKADPRRILDLPEGFSYQIISQAGQTMSDGWLVPGQPDGMGCFALDGSLVALVRNHELRTNATHPNLGPNGFAYSFGTPVDPARAYGLDKQGRVLTGGTSTVIYDLESRRTVREFLSLAGTSTNCAGGPTPWGSWLTCEETEETPANSNVTREHGYIFEVPARAEGLVDPVPLKAMGRFAHEAVCVDPRTGIVYLTEDKADSLFYRFIPNVKGELARGGKLQAMGFRGAPGANTTNHTSPIWVQGDWRDVVWIDLEDVESPNGDLRKRGHAAGAAMIARGEGIWWGEGELYLTATSGGPLKAGQVMRYVPSVQEGESGETRAPGRMQLFVESTDTRVVFMADNLTIAPWGHLILCEDNYSEDQRNHIKGVAPDGRIYTIARNSYAGNSEFAGAVFSPDGQTLFVNIMSPGLTIAIRGPWDTVQTA